MKIEEYFNHDDLIDFYISRDIEFDEAKKYPHPPLFSYIAKINDSFVGAITVCKENDDYILDEVAVIPEKENIGIGTALVVAALERIKQDNKNKETNVYLVAKNPDFFKARGFNIISREEAPAFSECFTCPDYINKICCPEIMNKKVK